MQLCCTAVAPIQQYHQLTENRFMQPGSANIEIVHKMTLLWLAESLYDVLGVTESANEREIKRAYRQKALKLHPDVNKAVRIDETAVIQQM